MIMYQIFMYCSPYVKAHKQNQCGWCHRHLILFLLPLTGRNLSAMSGGRGGGDGVRSRIIWRIVWNIIEIFYTNHKNISFIPTFYIFYYLIHPALLGNYFINGRTYNSPNLIELGSMVNKYLTTRRDTNSKTLWYNDVIERSPSWNGEEIGMAFNICYSWVLIIVLWQISVKLVF